MTNISFERSGDEGKVARLLSGVVTTTPLSMLYWLGRRKSRRRWRCTCICWMLTVTIWLYTGRVYGRKGRDELGDFVSFIRLM